MQKIVVFLISVSISLSVVFAQGNSLISVKVVPLRQDKLRIDFQFTQPLKQPPANFITQKPARIVLDFVDSKLQLSVAQRSQQIKISSLNAYNIVSMGPRIRAVLDLDRPLAYSGNISKAIYSLIIHGRRNDLSQEKTHRSQLQKKIFSGKLISLNFQNIGIRAVLQLLADFTGINIVVSERVQGSTTLRLNNVPWDQALDIILTTHRLDKRQTANVMFIDDKNYLEKLEQQQLENQQSIQNLEPVRSELLQINYAKATDLAILIKDRHNSLLSDKGKISVDTRTNTIWIQDTGMKIGEVHELIKQLDVPVKQVLIEARIVEVSKDFSRDLGIRWGVSKPTHLSGTLQGANQLAQGTAPVNVIPYAQRLNLDLAAIPATAIAPPSIGIALAKLGDNILLDLELSALESEGKAELISSPRLITTNQQPAVIDSGEEIPYQEATSSGATAVAFKKAVLSLKVTPQITPDSKILMDLKINQDTASQQLFNGVPAILTKEIHTNVLVGNAQTIVLGGIYQQDKTKTITRIPFLGRLPIVGNLFRNQQITLKNDELLIFITPKIITNSLTITAIEGRKHNRAALLDKFGKPIILDHK